MNFQGNRGQITTTLDNASLFNNLQAELISKTNNETPLLLMPLRLETRFMRVTKNLLEVVLSPDVTRAVTRGEEVIGRINDYTQFGQFAGPKVLLAASLVREDIEMLRDSINAAQAANFLEKELIAGLSSRLDQASAAMLNHLQGFVEEGSAAHAEFQQVRNAIPDVTNQLRLRAEQAPLSTEWQGMVRETVWQLRNAIASTIESNASLLQGGLNEGMVQVFTSNLGSIGAKLRTIPAYNGGEKLAVLQALDPLNAQIGMMLQRIDNVLDGSPAAKAARKKDVYKTVASISDVWQDVLFPGLDRDIYVKEIPDAEIITPGHAIAPQIADGRNALRTRVESLKQYTDQLAATDTQWEPQQVNILVNQLIQIDQVLGTLPAVGDADDQRYLYQGLREFNTVVYKLINYLKAHSPSDQVQEQIISNLEGFYISGNEILDAAGMPVSPAGGYGISGDGALVKFAPQRVSAVNGLSIATRDVIRDASGRTITPSSGYYVNELGYLIRPDGSYLGNRRGFAQQGNAFIDHLGRPLSLEGGYYVRAGGALMGPGPEILTESAGYSISSQEMIVDAQGRSISASSGYYVDDQGFIITPEGSYFGTRGGFTQQGVSFIDASGNPLSLQGGYSVRGDGALVPPGPETITTDHGYGINELETIVDGQGRAINASNGYFLDGEGYIITPEGDLFGSRNGFFQQGTDFYDSSGNPLSIAGGYEVSPDGRIVSLAAQVVSIGGGYGLAGEHLIIDGQGRPVAPTSGYFINGPGLIFSPEGMPFSNLTGFHPQGPFFIDAHGRPLNPEGGYSVNADGIVVAQNPQTISHKNEYSVTAKSRMIDMWGRTITPSSGYYVDGAGFIITPEGQSFGYRRGFSAQGDSFFDAAGRQLSLEGGYQVSNGLIMTSSPETIFTGGGFSVAGSNIILDPQGRPITISSGYFLNGLGAIITPEGASFGYRKGFYVEGNSFVDALGRQLSQAGGFTVADGVIVNYNPEPVATEGGFGVVAGNGIVDAQGRSITPSGGYFLDGSGFVTAPDGSLFSTEKEFTQQGDAFVDAQGRLLSLDGGYGIDSASFLTVGSEIRVSPSGLFHWSGDQIVDMGGQPLNAGGGYQVDAGGRIVKLIAGAVDTTGMIGSVKNTALGIGHEWSRVITATSVSKAFSSTYEVDELWVRAYPDDIFVTHHEEALTQEEHDAGVAYWADWWAANGSKDLQQLAWQNLALKFGAQRAAWIVKVLTPNNVLTPAGTGTAQVLNAQLATLQTFGSQIGAVSAAPSQQQSLSYYLGVFESKVQAIQASANDLAGTPEQLFSELIGNVEGLKANFTNLAGQLAVSGQDLQEATISISNRLDYLSEQIGGLNKPENWSDQYAVDPSFPDAAVKGQAWIEQSYSETLPHRLVFSTINKVIKPNNPQDGTYTFNHIKIGNIIPDTVYTSLKPDIGNPTSQNTVNTGNIGIDKGPTGELIFDPSIKWMFNYDEAEAKGMACSIRLTTAEAQAGFDTVIVTGVKTNEGNFAWSDEQKTRDKSRQLLEKLLTSHQYSEGGLELLKLGTPTNNTDDSDAGFNQPDPYHTGSFNTFVSAPLFTYAIDKANRRDGQWISDVLGVNYNIFRHVKGANYAQIGNAIAMNRALWSATAGGYMDEMLDRIFTTDNIARTKSYFTDYVLARGISPSIRVGEQPYGILATSSFTRWHTPNVFDLDQFLANLVSNKKITQTNADDLRNELDGPEPGTLFNQYIAGNAAILDAFHQERFNTRSQFVLRQLSNIWLEMFEKHGQTMDRINARTYASPEARQAAFMNALGADATLSEAHVRFMLNAFTYYHTSGNSSFEDIASETNSLLSSSPVVSGYITQFKNLFITPQAPPLFDIRAQFNTSNPSQVAIQNFLNSAKIFSAQQLTDHFYLNTPRVDETELREDVPVTSIPSLNKNYIQWLLDSPLDTIWNNNVFNQLPARSLLFQLLRQSMLLTYRNEAMNILERSSVLSKVSRNILGTTDGIALQLSLTTTQRILTKWHLLFNSLDVLSKDNNLKDVLYGFLSFNGNPGSFSMNAVPLPPTWNTINLGSYLKSNATTNATVNGLKHTAAIDELTEAFEVLQKAPGAELDRLLSEHIDLCSYRLDAWNYGMVHRRLMEQRDTETSGIRNMGSYIGAYGWLLDIRPKNKGVAMPNVNSKIHPLLQSAAGVVSYDATNLGYIHTPSITHAITAAMLRSGFVSERIADDNSFSVNLTSQRVKKAVELLEGMRAGQTLSELLGYEFEKGLYDRGASVAGLQEYVAFFRRVFPLVEDNTSAQPIAQAEVIRPTNVADGIELLNSFKSFFATKIRANPTDSIYELFTAPPLPGQPGNGALLDSWVTSLNGPLAASLTVKFNTNSAAAAALVTEIDQIANAIDAVGDLALTEGVFQLSRGNHDRSAAVMDALSKGKNMPELEVTETPRTGHRISNRLVSLLQTQYVPAQFTTVKSTLEPRVNSWIENLLMDYLGFTDIYKAIGCKATFTDSNTPQNTHDVDVLLEDLGINGIELAYLVQNADFLSELTGRVQYAVRDKWTGTAFLGAGGVPAAVEIKVDLGTRGATPLTPATAAGTTTFSDIATIIDAIHNVVTNARFLSPDDFVFSAEDSTSAPKFDLTNDVAPRVAALTDAFNPNLPASLRSRIDARISAGPNSIATQTDLDTVNDLLMECLDLGIGAAMPRYVRESTVDAAAFALIAKEIYEQLLPVKAELVKRYAQLTTPSTTAGEDEQLGVHLDNVNALLGRKFLLLPKFRFAHYAGLETLLHAQLDKQRPGSAGYSLAEDLLSHVNTPASSARRDEIMDDWMYSLARVAQPVDDLETVRMLTGSTALDNLRPVQIPFIEPAAVTAGSRDYWVGTDYPASYDLLGDKLSIAIFNSDIVAQPASSPAQNEYCGIFIHNWEETIPVKEETTGITFHYDQPNAKAPQNLLLAVHPGCSNPALPSASHWQLEDVLYTLLDTIEMSKVRLVEPDHFKSDSTDASTAKFDLFKWMLPAVVGEITPHNVDKSNPNNIINSFQGKTDSIQQVSFEYNPLGQTLTNTQTTNTGPVKANASSVNLTSMSATVLLQDPNAQNFISQQTEMNAIAATIDQLQNP